MRIFNFMNMIDGGVFIYANFKSKLGQYYAQANAKVMKIFVVLVKAFFVFHVFLLCVLVSVLLTPLV